MNLRQQVAEYWVNSTPKNLTWSGKPTPESFSEVIIRMVIGNLEEKSYSFISVGECITYLRRELGA